MPDDGVLGESVLSLSTRKNWLPVEWAADDLAIATVPRVYLAPVRFSSGRVYPGVPLPVPVGSPHCSTVYGWDCTSRLTGTC